MLVLEDGHCLRDQALSVCELAEAREADTVRASSLGTLVQMVAAGLGITLLPASAVGVEIHERDEIALRPFGARPPHRAIGLVWRRASARGEEFRRLGELLRCHAPGAPRGLKASQRAPQIG